MVMEDFNNIQTAEIINLGLIRDIGEQYYLKRYMKPSGHDLQVYEIEHCVLADVK